MENDVDITPLIDTGYVRKVVQEGQNAVFKNNRLVYIIIDVDKPGKYFFDLRQVFNASTGEGGKDLKIMFMNNAVPWQLNGKTISIKGKYPSGVPFSVTGSVNQASSSLVDFVFPLGLFQEAGIYKFQFEVSDESGNLATSHYCFFQVTQSATSMAFNWSNGVNPFDSDYVEWKVQVEKEIEAVRGEVASVKVAGQQIKDMMQTYLDNTESYADTAWAKKLQQDNTWGGTQTFDKTEIKEFNAKDVNSDNFSGSNMTLDGSLTLTNAPALKYVGGNIARGFMTFEDEFFVATNPADNRGGANFVNGVQPGAGGQNYMNFRVFRIPDTDGKGTHILTEIHANCKIPDSAVGKTIVQFPTSTHMFEGIDQTPFFLGNWILQFSGADKTLRVQGKIDSSGTNNLQDSKMI